MLDKSIIISIIATYSKAVQIYGKAFLYLHHA